MSEISSTAAHLDDHDALGDARWPALRSVRAHIAFWTVAVSGLTLDLWSKAWAFDALDYHDRVKIVPGVLEFHLMLNPGALFGIGEGRTTLFLLASAAALALVLWMFAQSSPRRTLLHIALGGILAGALGNMYDRWSVQLVKLENTMPMVLIAQPDGGAVLRPYIRGSGVERPLSAEQVAALPAPTGFVRDFLKIPTKLWGEQDLWPWVFNVADMLLVGGVGILAIYLWREPKPQPTTDPEPGSPSPAAAGNIDD